MHSHPSRRELGRADTFSVEDRPADPSFLDRGMSVDETVSWMIADEAGIDDRRIAASGRDGQSALKLLRAATKSRSPERRADLIERAVRAVSKLRGKQHGPLVEAVLARVAELAPAPPSHPQTHPRVNPQAYPRVNPETGLQEFFFEGFKDGVRNLFVDDTASGPDARSTPPQPVDVPSGLLATPPQQPSDGLLNIPPIPVTTEQYPRALQKWQDREASIKSDTPSTFFVSDNPEASSKQPWYSFSSLGQSAVADHEGLIDKHAALTGIDPDLLKSVIYVENARGGVYGRVGEAIDKSETILPGNIDRNKWGSLIGETGTEWANDPNLNIHAAAELLKRIGNRAGDPNIAKIATLYNSLPKEKVSDYGARVARIYGEKPWENKK